ncbi:MAG: SDR family NAD(P)-dependent oxidoreductase, partial [Dongiaceae bacterium]
MAADLTGRVALVTGAGSPTGIGFACARILGRQGAKLAISSTTERIQERVAALKAAGTPAIGMAADLTESAQANALIDAALAAYGRIDVLVNNAGMVSVGEAEIHRDLATTSDEEWRRGMDISLTTAFFVTRAVLPGMIARSHGRIVNVASVTGPVVSNPRSGFYSAAKAGMVGLTRSLAIEVARNGITVNAVLPGWIQ